MEKTNRQKYYEDEFKQTDSHDKNYMRTMVINGTEGKTRHLSITQETYENIKELMQKQGVKDENN